MRKHIVSCLKATKNTIYLSATAIVLIGLSAQCFAINPLIADDYDPVDAGKSQIEVYYTSIRQRDATQVGALGLQIKKGVNTSFDIGLNLPVLLPQISDLGNSFLSAKWRLPGYASNEGFSAKLGAGIENNPLSKRVIKGMLNLSGSLIYSKKLGNIKTHYTLGLTKNGGFHVNNLLDWYTESSFTGIIPFQDIDMELVFEYNLDTSEIPNPQMLQFGTKKTICDWLAMDLGYSMGLNSNSPANLYAFGLAYIF